MSTTQPIELIANFVRHNDPHVRRNVAAALGAVADDDSISTLVQMALADADTSVREAAETQLSRLEPDGLQKLRGELMQRVQSTNVRTAIDGIDLVGRLKYRGLTLRESDEGLLTRVRRLLRANGSLAALRTLAVGEFGRFRRVRLTYAIRWRRILAGIIGGAIVATALGAYVRSMFSMRGDELGAYVFLTVIAALIALILSTRRTVPLVAQWDPAAALVRDAIETARWTFSLTLVLLTILLAGDEGVAIWPAFVLAMIGGAAVAAGMVAVHVGNYLATDTWRSRLAAWAWHFVVGLGTATAVQTGLLWIARRFVHNDHEARMVEGLWLFALPAAGAIAFVVSRLDAAPSTTPPADRWRSPKRRVAIVFAVVAIAMGGLAASRSWRANQQQEILEAVDWRDVSGKTKDDVQPLRYRDTDYRFWLPNPQRVVFEAGTSVRPLGFDYALRLSSVAQTGLEGAACLSGAGTTSTIEDVDDPPRISSVLAAGCYTLRVYFARPLTTGEVMIARSPFAIRGVEPEARMLRVRLNESKATFLGAEDQLTEGQAASWVVQSAASEARVRRIEATRSWMFGVGATATGQIPIDAGYGQENSSAVLKLTNAAGDSVSLGAVLQPGRYVLNVAPAKEGVPVSVYAEFTEPVARRAGYEPTIEPAITPGSTAAYAQTPVVFPFRQRSTGKVSVSTEEMGTDLVLEVWHRPDWTAHVGRPVESGDDPPMVESILDAGDYVAVIRRYSEERDERPTPLPRRHTITLGR